MKKLEDKVIFKKKRRVELEIKLQNIFAVGQYSVTATVKKRDRTKNFAIKNDIINFEVKNITPYSFNTLLRPSEKAAIRYANDK
jgi:hypothetical protein